MNYFKLLLTYLAILSINSSVFGENIENYYSSINLDYTFSEGDIDGDGYQFDFLYQVTGGNESGLALLITNSSTTVDEINNIALDPAIDLNIDHTSFGLGYVFKNTEWHIIPYFTAMDFDLELNNGFNVVEETFESTTFGIMFRKSLTSTIAFTYNLNIIDLDDDTNTFTVDGRDYTIEDNTAISFKIEQAVSDAISLTYGIRHLDGTNTFSGGLSYSF